MAPAPARDRPQLEAGVRRAPLRHTAELLREVRDVLSRFVILPGVRRASALALYVLHTYAFDAAHCTPYLVLRSAAKRSGKTRLEEVLEFLVRSPWRIAAASESAMFRKIERRAADIAARRGRRAVRREVRGHRTAPSDPECRQPSGRGRPAVVGEGANMQPADFEVYCPKVLAGIVTSRWPDTVWIARS